MSTQRTPLSDRELWNSLATEPSMAPAAVSDMDFAAWLEGRLPEPAAARIEAAVASDPAMRRAALEMADILGMPLPASPPRMTVRAQALVGFEAERQARRKSWLVALFPAFGEGFALQRGAIAGVAVIVAAVGFMLGGGLGETYVEGKYTSVQAPIIAKPFGRDTINDLNDLFSDNT
jgi:anti-sigma factor RsiW